MKRRIRALKAAKFAFTVAIITALCFLAVDLARYPEAYISTWRYQLKNDIEQGNQKAIEYYQYNYVESGRELFE